MTSISRALRTALITWLPVAIASCFLALAAYTMVQQDLRLSGNDPQEQMAVDAAHRLDAGASASEVLPPDPIDLATSLSPYVMVFDSSGRLVASSASIGGARPDYPVGALTSTRQGGLNRVTWQTASGLREATVVVPFKSGYVVGGRSLRLTEGRIDTVTQIAILCLLGALVGSAALALGAAWLLGRPTS